MEEKKPANKEVFRKTRNKYYLRGEEREQNKVLFLFLFFKIVATVSCQKWQLTIAIFDSLL